MTIFAVLTCPYTNRLDKTEGAPDQPATLRLLIATGKEISQRTLSKE